MSLEYVQIRPDHAEALRDLELTCFPTIPPERLLSVHGARMQAEKFPEGGIVVLDGADVVAMGLGCLVDYDISVVQHRFGDVVGDYVASNHDPDGTWYYGTSIAVHPDYRGQGIGRRLYDFRKDVVIRLNRAGIIAGGVIPGFAEHKHEMSAAEYVRRVAGGELFDPTLSFQIRNGFEALGIIADYLPDPAVDNWATFIVWHNPQYRPEEHR